MKLKMPVILNIGTAFVFLCIFTLSAYLKIFPVLNNNFPFTMDQARDMLDIRAIVELRKPTLIGPTTSINGVFLGPFYYYFNLLPYIFFSGDPAALTYWNIAWYMIASILLFVFFYKENKIFGFLSSIIFLMAPSLFYSSRYFWSANPMPYMTVFYFLSILNLLRKTNYINASLIGLISGASMQIEAAFGVLFLPFFVLFGAVKRVGVKYIFFSIAAFFATLLPQIIFELRHGFLMSKTFFSEISGKSQILGDKLTIDQVFLNHLQSFTQFLSGEFQIPAILSTMLLIASIIYLTYIRNKLCKLEKNLFFLSIGFILFAFIFYMLYSFPLKGWYLLGLHIPYIFLFSLFLSEIFKQKFFRVLVVLFLTFSFFATFTDQSRFIQTENFRSLDKSTLRNEIEVIDWVYIKANSEGFKAYNYIPSVYDFPYQYLYWWHGGKKYGYHPETLTYLDGVPEYIQDSEKFLTKKRAPDDSTIFLIYEPDEESKERLFAWLGNFTKFCSVEKQIFSWGTTAELRRPCN